MVTREDIENIAILAKLFVAEEDLDKACLMSLKNTADFVRSAGKYLDNDTVLAEEYLEEVIKEKEKNLEGKND